MEQGAAGNAPSLGEANPWAKFDPWRGHGAGKARADDEGFVAVPAGVRLARERRAACGVASLLLASLNAGAITCTRPSPSAALRLLNPLPRFCGRPHETKVAAHDMGPSTSWARRKVA